MIAVLTGDFIRSRGAESTEVWMESLKSLLSEAGETPAHWQILRKDSFQFKIPAKDCLRWALKVDTCMRTTKGMGARIGVGLGEEAYGADSILESNGSAYVYSGMAFKQLDRTGQVLRVQSDSDTLDQCLNSGLDLLMALARQWSSNQAQLALALLQRPDHSQEEIASLFHISQSAVSQRKKRAHIDPIERYLHYSETVIEQYLNKYTAAE
jgi:hypothetical protein